MNSDGESPDGPSGRQRVAGAAVEPRSATSGDVGPVDSGPGSQHKMPASRASSSESSESGQANSTAEPGTRAEAGPRSSNPPRRSSIRPVSPDWRPPPRDPSRVPTPMVVVYSGDSVRPESSCDSDDAPSRPSNVAVDAVGDEEPFPPADDLEEEDLQQEDSQHEVASDALSDGYPSGSTPPPSAAEAEDSQHEVASDALSDDYPGGSTPLPSAAGASAAAAPARRWIMWAALALVLGVLATIALVFLRPHYASPAHTDERGDSTADPETVLSEVAGTGRLTKGSRELRGRASAAESAAFREGQSAEAATRRVRVKVFPSPL